MINPTIKNRNVYADALFKELCFLDFENILLCADPLAIWESLMDKINTVFPSVHKHLDAYQVPPLSVDYRKKHKVFFIPIIFFCYFIFNS